MKPNPPKSFLDEVRKWHAEAENKWIGQCVKDFCPEAYEMVISGDTDTAKRLLSDEGWNVLYNDDEMEFRCGETVIARAEFRVNFTSGSSLFSGSPTETP